MKVDRKSFWGFLGLLALVLAGLAAGWPDPASFAEKESSMATSEQRITHPDGPTRYALFAAG